MYAIRSYYDLGVELAAAERLQLFQGFCNRFSRFVDAIGGHGVKGVGHRNDPRKERDRLTLQPVRIAVAVIALMMMADDCREFIVHGNARQHGMAGAGMELDQLVIERSYNFV